MVTEQIGTKMPTKLHEPAEPDTPDQPDQPDQPAQPEPAPEPDTPAAPDDAVYEETADLPAGRKTRQIPASLWAKLEESAKRRVGFARTSDPDTIDQLRRDLASKTVKAKYDVSTQTAKLDNGLHKLTFSATAKVEE